MCREGVEVYYESELLQGIVAVGVGHVSHPC